MLFRWLETASNPARAVHRGVAKCDNFSNVNELSTARHISNFRDAEISNFSRDLLILLRYVFAFVRIRRFRCRNFDVEFCLSFRQHDFCREFFSKLHKYFQCCDSFKAYFLSDHFLFSEIS